MYKFDHFIINIDTLYQSDQGFIKKLNEKGFLYEPEKGKGNKGFKVSNLWIGDEYFEMVNIFKSDGGGFKKEWVEKYNEGYRGLICLMLDVDDIDKVYNRLKAKGVKITKPEYLKFKIFKVVTKKMPWRNSYVDFFEKIPLQIGFQEIDSKEDRENLEKYMIPNSIENGIKGIDKVYVKGPVTKRDKDLLKEIFEERVVSDEPFAIVLSEDHLLVFEEGDEYEVTIETRCEKEEYKEEIIKIENVFLTNK